LSTRGLLRVNLKLQEQDFAFIAGGVSYPCPSLIAEFLSPRVSHLRAVDPTIVTFRLETSDPKHYFSEFLATGYGSGLHAQGEKMTFLRSVCGELWNFEFMDLLFAESKDAMTREALIPRLEFLSQACPTSEFDVKSIAANFHLLNASDCADLELQLLGGIIGHPDLVVQNEDALLEMISDRISRDSSDFSLLEFVRFEYLSAQGIKSAVDLISASFELFSYGIWSRFANRLLLPVQPPETHRRSVGPVLDSKIIPEFPSTFEEFQGREFKLLYRGSRDGFQSTDFHRTCDGHGHTVSLISSQNGFIFGGYTALVWNSSTQWTSDRKRKSFLFTIKNPHGLPPRTFPLGRDGRANAIYNQSTYGPLFGSGHDLCIHNQCNAFNSSSTNLGYSYTNDSGIPGNSVLTGAANFVVEEIEVFEITQQ
jgi:hypothetical protein